jgi:hypothetical protein
MFGWSAWNAGPDLHRVYDVEISADFTPAQRRQVERGAHLWEDAIPGLAFFFVVHRGENKLIRILPGTEADLSAEFERRTGKHHNVVGLYNPQPDGHLFIGLAVDVMVGDELTEVAAHELGHAMGLDDDYKHPGALMYWKIDLSAPLGPTPRDVRAWYRVNK